MTMTAPTPTAAPSAARILDLAAYTAKLPEGFSVDLIHYDATASTAWQRVYLVPSKRQTGRLRRVVYTEETRTWRCSCPAQPGTCWHCAMAALAMQVWWWRQLWRGLDAATLVEQDRQYRALFAEGEASEEDRIAFGALGDVLLERMAA